MKAVVFSPSLLQGVLSFTASRRAFSLSRISKLGSTNGSHNIQNLHRAASDVGSFLEVVEMKPLSATKIIIGPSTEFDIGLSTKLAGAVFGIEGMNIFPSVFNPKYSWKPSEAVLNSVKSSILLSKFNTNGDLGEDASMPKMCNTVNISAGNLLPELLSHVCNHGDIGTRLSLQHQVIIAAGWHVAGMWIQVQGLTNMFTYDAPTRGPLEPCLFTSEDVFPLTAEEIRTLRNAEANVSAQTGPLEFSAPPTGSASVAVLEYKPTVHGSLYDSQALLYCTASLINQMIRTKSSEPRIGFSILTDGHTWRFVALQLNTLDFDAALRGPGTVKNAVWVYESQLYSESNNDIIVHPEVLGILHHIFSTDHSN